jgi:dTDP-4-amino-4,6-dideoxygalactose transaminase
MEGAIGQEQLKKMDGMIKQRRKNAEYFKNRMQKFEDIRIQKEIGESSWFGFALLLQGKLLGQRDKIVHALRENGIETRPIVAGNFTRNKVIEYMDYSIPEKLVNADDIHFNGFFIGNHSSNNNKEIDYFIKVLDEAIKQ